MPDVQLTPSSPLLLVAQAWLGFLEHRVRQGQLKAHTVSLYRRDIGLLAALAERIPASIAPPDVIRWHEQLCETQTSARAFACYQSLRALLSFARRRGLAVTNPAMRLAITHRAKPARPLTPLEVVRFRAGLDELDCRRRAWATRAKLTPTQALGLLSSTAALRLLELTGRRLAEIASIRVSAVRLEIPCIFLPDTKTGPSAVPLASQAIELVARQLAHLGGRSEWLFPSPAGLRHITPCSVWEAFHKSCGLAGIFGANPHDLRHSWIMTALTSGMAVADVASGVGHQSEQTTRKHYMQGVLLLPGGYRAAQQVQDARTAAAAGRVGVQ